MPRIAHFENDALKRALDGSHYLYRHVATTYGPKGRNVAIEDEYGNVHFTHDGVTVARAVDIPFSDETAGQMVGVKAFVKASEKLNAEVADATSTVAVLGYHILNEAYKLIIAGHNPMILRREVEAAAEAVLKPLAKLGYKIETDQQLEQVATVSCGEPELGKLIADVVKQVGPDGVVTVEHSTDGQTTKDVTKGYTFDRGWSSPHFITNIAKQEVVIENPDIILTDGKIESESQLAPIFKKLREAKRQNIVIITADITNDMLALMVVNKVQHKANIAVVKAPSFGNVQANTLDDIGFLIGGTPASRTTGRSLESLEAKEIGTADRIIIGREKTTIVNGHGERDLIEARLEQLTEEIKATESEYEKDKLQTRKAALSGQVALIRAGGMDEIEIKERKDRIDDAVGATKAALAEGIVAGGGVTLIELIKYVPDTTGGLVLKRALDKPFLKLMENAGENGDALLRDIARADSGYGFNMLAMTDEPVDMIEAGIIDPIKATRTALKQAVSTACSTMTLGAISSPVAED